jgi:hypothetical protein
MVEFTVCKNCAAQVAPGHAVCPSCGAALGAREPAATEAAAADLPATGQVRVPAGWPVAADDLRRSSARDVAARAAAAARDAAAQAAAEKAAAVNADRDAEAEEDAVRGAELTPSSDAEDGARTSDRYLAPSASHRTLGSIGGGRPGGGLAGSNPASVPSAAPVPAATPVVAPAPNAGALAGNSGPFVAGAMRPALPVVPIATSDRIKATLASIAGEPKTELVATGLTALGGAFALISFLLPWTADNGLGVGTVDVNPRPGAWAFDTAAGWPLFLIAAMLLASILASDKLEQLMPALAPTIRRLTEVAMPMLLGGILLGTALLYQTLPWGCGGGITILALGAALLIVGSTVGLFFPAGERQD